MNREVFKAKAPGLMKRFMGDFSCTKEDAAAVFGNGGHESGGFTQMQEISPTVAGSRGGYGWFQWTGIRRRQFESFCRVHSLGQDTDDANYAFLCHELRNGESGAISRMRNAKSLRDKVIEFELGYERAGVKHYDSRVKWAQIALDAFNAKYGNGLAPKKTSKATAPVVVGGAAGGAGAAAHQAGLPVWAVFAIIAAVGLAAFLVWKFKK